MRIAVCLYDGPLELCHVSDFEEAGETVADLQAAAAEIVARLMVERARRRRKAGTGYRRTMGDRHEI